jgi:hypothetical protein
MSQSYRPWVKKQSRAEHLAEFDRTMDWLEGLVGHTAGGRFQKYRARLSQAFRLLLEDRPDQILKQIPPAEFIEINFEANALIEIWRQFRTDVSPILVEKLSKIARGQLFTSNEGRKTEPRDILFELELAAFLRELGLVVSLGGLSDFTAEFQDLSALCECKRVQTPNALEANLQDAGPQLATALSRWKEPRRCMGIVGLNVSKIIHLDVSSVPRYPETQYGDYLLPADIVAVKHEAQFGAAVRERMLSFVNQHIRTLQRPVPEHVAGYILFYRISGMDMSGTGRMFVNTYPQMGTLNGASEGEDKLLRSLHAELLKKFQ